MEALDPNQAGMAVDLSIWTLALQADMVVKAVLIILVLASLWCWVIIFEKSRQLARVRAKADAFEDSFWSGGSLEELYERVGQAPDNPMAMLFSVAMREWTLATAHGAPLADERRQAGLESRVDRVMTVAMQREMEGLESRIGFLATVGSTAPFVGLFGTVWGIMNSFQSIAMTRNTSLAVVAPGIAEALLATALGLVAAIPAVVAYNKLSGDLNRYAGRLETFAGEFSALLSRQMGERVA